MHKSVQTTVRSVSSTCMKTTCSTRGFSMTSSSRLTSHGTIKLPTITNEPMVCFFGLLSGAYCKLGINFNRKPMLKDHPRELDCWLNVIRF